MYVFFLCDSSVWMILRQLIYLMVTEVVELLDRYFLNHFRISNQNHRPLPQVITSVIFI